jgi:type IV secretion system protein VirB6
MIGQCAAPRSDLGLVKGLLDTVDCNIREGVQGGYNAFFGPGSTLSAVITVLLTLYVALLGFRLLTGRTDLRVGDLPMIAIKLGAVVMLTTSWASYQSLVFSLLFDGPAELANSLLANMPLPQSAASMAGGGDIFARLQYSFDQLTQSASAMALVSDEPGQGPNAAGAGLKAGSLVLQAAPGTDPNSLKGLSPVIQMRSALQGGPAFGATALWLSSIILLVSTLGLLILSKLMLGLLLAIGPIFVGLLLFDQTKGFFEGWLRTSLGFALVPLATVVFMAGMLASLEPSLQGLAVARAENRYAIEPVLTVLVIVLTFTAVFGSVIGLCTRLVAGFRLPDAKPREPELVVDIPAFLGREGGAGNDAANEGSRASRLAAMVGGNNGTSTGDTDRRDTRLASAVMMSGDRAGGSPNSGGTNTSSTTMDRRTEVAAGASGASSDAWRADTAARLGQAGRRRANPVRANRPQDSNLGRPVSKLSLPSIGTPV